MGAISSRIGGSLGNAFSFKKAAPFLDSLKASKETRNPIRFIVTRMGFDYSQLWNTNMLCTVENYTICEDARNGNDLNISIVLKQYKFFGTKEVEVTKNEDGTETLRVKEPRYTPTTQVPAMMKITNQLSVLEACKGVIGGNLDWRTVANASGVTNPLEKNIKGQVLKLV